MILDRLHRKAVRTKEKFRRKIVKAHMAMLRSMHTESPVGLRYWSAYHRLMGMIFSKPNPITPSGESLFSYGRSLKICEIRDLLANDQLGPWALDAETIYFLWKELMTDQPRFIIECGSGASTLIFAKYAALASRQGYGCYVVSIEQDEQTACHTQSRLAASGLEGFASVVHVLLDHEGGYSGDAVEANILSVFPGGLADFVLIDGPGPPGSRLGTLPMLVPFCRDGAKWYLDDAVRDRELSILRKWRTLPGITVQGIYPVGKGMATGITSPLR